MPNWLELLRMGNIFNPQSMEMNQGPMPQMPQSGTMMPPSPPPIPNIPVQSGLPMQQPEFDVTARMKELYQPSTVATDRFNELSQSMPRFAEPSGWRKFGAAALGSLTDLGTNFGGNRTGVKGTDVFDETTGKNKWRERMGSWKEEIGPAQQAANLERQENINSRTLAHQTVQGELTSRRNDATVRNQEINNKIRQQRADAYDYRVRNPNVKFDFNGPRVRILNPGTGQITETSWESKDFTPQEKLELEQKQAIERIEKTGAEARKTEETRQENRTDIAETRGWKPYTDAEGKVFMYNEITGETRDRAQSPAGTPTPRPSGAAARPELATQTKVRQYNAAIEFKNRNPELGRWVTPGPGNTFTIKPPKTGTFGSGPSPQQYEMMINEIYGPDGPPQEGQSFQSSGPGGGRGGGSGRQTGPRFSPGSPPQAPQGWKYVPKKGGGWTAVPG